VSASILVVDDDPSYQAMLGLSLRKRGHSVRLAGGGAQALQLLRAEKFDWLVTDAKMSPMDGFQLAREAALLQPALRIVMISAVSTNEDIASSPIEKTFSKPAALEELFAWLDEARPKRCEGDCHDTFAADSGRDLRDARRRHPGDLHQGN
jgi:CheY-like chemotaxis protein